MNETSQNDEHEQEYGRDQVVKIISSVISKVEGAEDFSRLAVFRELKELQTIIDEARKEIGFTNPTEISDKHIPTATDELDEVVNATAEATGTIMDACEVIEDTVSTIEGEAGELIGVEVTKIYEACSFQDITGQRITKVVTTLRTIEEKVATLLSVLGEKMPGWEGEEGGAEGEDGGDSLLNGPQMADQAITQDEIDKLLAEFD